jgi:hypothetical protein
MNDDSKVLIRNGLDAADIGWSKRSLKSDGASMRDVLETVARLLDTHRAHLESHDYAAPEIREGYRTMADVALSDARAIIAEVLLP